MCALRDIYRNRASCTTRLARSHSPTRYNTHNITIHTEMYVRIHVVASNNLAPLLYTSGVKVI